MKVRYIGRSSTGISVALESGDVFVPHGGEVDVSAEVAASLIEQSGQFELVKSPSKSGAAGSPKE